MVRAGESRVRLAIALTALLLTAALPLAAQPPAPSAIAEAQRLRDAGNFTAAAEVLRTQLARQPNDGEAARLLAQTLYWLKDLGGAERVYNTALAQHPEDTTLRLQYGRMLAETKQYARAQATLGPLRQVAATRAEADTLLGTIAYWQGDFTTAKRMFTEALDTNPSQPDATRQLAQILSASAPWVRVSSSVRHDDQPLDRLALGLEAGWFATPLVPVTIRVEPLAIRPPDAAVRRLWSAEAVVAGFMPHAWIETELAGGVVQRLSGVDTTEWRGRAVLGLRLAPSLTLRGRAERTPYLYTVSSITTPLMTTAVGGLMRLDHPRGWLGEVGLQVERFPDDNRVNSGYAWLLAPIVYRNDAKLQAGYAFGRGNADESRFVLAAQNQPYLPSDPRFDTTGRYVPYYTPANLVTHSVTAALTIHPTPPTTLRLNGSYAVHATDDAPAFVVSSGQVQRITNPRDFSPWKAGSSIDITVKNGVTLELEGELGRTSFYTWAAAEIRLTYRFLSGPARRDNRH